MERLRGRKKDNNGGGEGRGGGMDKVAIVKFIFYTHIQTYIMSKILGSKRPNSACLKRRWWRGGGASNFGIGNRKLRSIIGYPKTIISSFKHINYILFCFI